jgi:hypothetical protein
VPFPRLWRASLRAWGVKYWCATLESNRTEGYHVHVMAQFAKKKDCTNRTFTFEGVAPRADANDLCGEGWSRKKMQESIDRGMFYVWANKTSSVFDQTGQQCMEGNYMPCWTECLYRYEVKGRWPEKLWKQRKVSSAAYENYLYLCRDGVPTRKRNFEAVKEREELVEVRAEVAARVQRIRNNPNLLPPWPHVPAAAAWLVVFKQDAVRYPILVVLGPSSTGKTEWANSLFRNALELKVGTLEHFPEGMRAFDRKQHDGVILDDVRDLAFVSNHQEKLQGKYNAPVEFGSTLGGTCAFFRDLFAVPCVVTVNYSTKNLGFLDCHDWLGKDVNRVVVQFPLTSADTGGL